MGTVSSVGGPKSYNGVLGIFSREEDGYQAITEISYKTGKMKSAKAGLVEMGGNVEYWASVTASRQWFIGTGESELTDIGRRLFDRISSIGKNALELYYRE